MSPPREGPASMSIEHGAGNLKVQTRDTTVGKGMQLRGSGPQEDVFARAIDEITIFDAWRIVGLPGEPKPSCLSPFRDERTKSFSIFNEGRSWKDFGADDAGDVIAFLCKALGKDHRELREWLKEYFGLQPLTLPAMRTSLTPTPACAPKEIKWPAPLLKGTTATWWGFAKGRGMSATSVATMIQAGLLRFTMIDGEKCFVITDETHKAAEIRKISRGTFGKAKAYPLAGVDKKWLPGAAWLRKACPNVGVFVVEGATDFLTAYDLYCRYRLAGGDRYSWVIVSLLGASCKTLDPECAELIRGRRVRIAPDADEAGDAMLGHWKQVFHRLDCAVDAVTQPRGTDLTDNAAGIEPESLFRR